MKECEGNCCACGLWKKPENDDENLLWKRNFLRKRMNYLLEILEEELDGEQYDGILQKLGRKCAGTVGWAHDHIGDPEGYFQTVHEALGEDFEYDRQNSTVRITTHNTNCFCPNVNESTSGRYCNCSLGWQAHMFETIYVRPVEVTLEKSILRGDDTCIFRVLIL